MTRAIVTAKNSTILEGCVITRYKVVLNGSAFEVTTKKNIGLLKQLLVERALAADDLVLGFSSTELDKLLAIEAGVEEETAGCTADISGADFDSYSVDLEE